MDCKRIQEQLTDVFFGEQDMSGQQKEHLEHCEECRGYWESLTAFDSELREEMKETGILTIEPDEMLIRQAFAKADGVLEERGKNRQFILFVGIALGVVGCLGLMIAFGKLDLLLYEQVVATLLTLIGLPFMVRQSLKKEW